MKDEDKNLDVLQNIEFAIATTYKDARDLTDYSVMSALEALIDSYTAEITGRAPRSFKLSPEEQTLFGAVRDMCEWRLGRGHLDEPLNELDVDLKKNTVEEILLCLKKVLKSARFWNREGGRRGYLDFIVRYF